MTAGQQIFDQGLEMGLEMGIEKGRRQGFQESLLRFLRQRFGGAVTPQVEQRIAAASLEQIDAWSARVLSAITLAELFAD